MNEDFKTFKANYSFMCLDSNKIEEASKHNQLELDKAMLYPYAKFPSEIIPGKLYLVLFLFILEWGGIIE